MPTFAGVNLRGRPYTTSAIVRGEGVKNLSKLPTDSIKKTAYMKEGQNPEKNAEVVDGWSLKCMLVCRDREIEGPSSPFYYAQKGL